MKNFIITALSVLLFSLVSVAEQTPSSASDGASTTEAGTSDQNQPDMGAIAEESSTLVKTNSTSAAITNFKEAYKNAGVNEGLLKEILERTKNANSAQELITHYSLVNSAVGQCVNYSAQAKNCCGSPESCGGSGGKKFKDFLKGTFEISPLLAALTGQGGYVSCLQAMQGMTKGLTSSTGQSKACNMLKNGANLTGDSSGQKPGCVKVCKYSQDIVSLFEAKIISASLSESGLSTLVSRVNSIKSEVSKSSSTCSSSLEQTKAKADAVTSSTQQTLTATIQCAENFLNDGSDTNISEEDEDPFSDPTNDPTNSENAAFSSLDSGGGAFEKLNADNSFLNATDGSMADDPLLADSTNPGGGGANQNTNAGMGPQGMGGMGAGGGMPGGGGGLGAENPTGQEGAMAREKTGSLIGGYAKSKGGSSSSGASKVPKKWGNLFKKEKDKKNADSSGALAALSKLVKAGISPNTSGSIFERVTQRFVTSSAKENMFDAKNNKKLWMNKK